MRRLVSRHAVLAGLGVPIAVVPLLVAGIVGTVLPWQRILGGLPPAARADNANHFGVEFAPLRDGFVRQVLGESSETTLAGVTRHDPAREESGLPRRPWLPPVGGDVEVSPGPEDDPPSVVWRSTSPSISADGSKVAYLSNDLRIEGMNPTPCVAKPPGPTTYSLVDRYWGPRRNAYVTPCEQVVIQDLRTGETVIASVGQDGEPADSLILTYMLSGDGRFVAFTTIASNLVPGDTNDSVDIFVRDLIGERTELISVSRYGGPIRRDDDLNFMHAGYPVDRNLPDFLASGSATNATISHDGRYVVFESSADDLVEGDTPQSVDVFVRDRLNATTERVSLSTQGWPARQEDVVRDNRQRLDSFQTSSAWPCMSPNGRYVAFRSWGSNLAPNDLNERPDLFVRDRVLRRTELITISTSGRQQDAESRPALGEVRWGNPGSWSLRNCISNDGRHVLFESGATNLVNDDTNGQWDVFLRDRVSSTTTRVNLKVDGTESAASTEWWVSSNPAPAADGATLSPDGKFVVFQSFAVLTSDEPADEGEYDIFVYDIAQRRLVRLAGAREDAGTAERITAPAPAWGAALVAYQANTGYTERLMSGVHVYRWRER